MEITTELDLGQKVWEIENNSTFSWINCPVCDGTAKVSLKGGLYKCPERNCHNGQIRKESPPQWRVTGTLTVGLIRCEVRDSPGMETELNADNYKPQKGRKDEFMCVETGIGSGYIYRLGDRIFVSKEAAQVECDRLNKEELKPMWKNDNGQDGIS